jgi:hypothetical protein
VGLLNDAEQDIQEQFRITSVDRRTRRDNIPHRISVTQTKAKGQSHRTCEVMWKVICTEQEIYCQKLDVGFCLGKVFENYHSR